MKKIVQLILSIFFIFILIGCQEDALTSIPSDPVDETPEVNLALENPHNDIYYQIFVRSFADSNQDGIGDINGITENLDYLVDLGITALWLLPINPSPSYHGYNVTDYLDIHPEYGTIEDFQNLIDQAYERGIKIVIDLVINHTSDQHPWFISARSSTSSPYRDYYIWNGNTAFESFVGGMKDLNFDNPEVVSEIKDIMDFYLEMGVHGFRIDAAKHIFEGMNADWRNTLMLLELNQHIKSNYPNSFVVSEVFEYDYNRFADYFIGSDSVFNFHAAINIWDKIGIGNARYLLVSNINRGYNAFRDIDPDFVDSPFIGNHDLDRIASMPGFQTFDGELKLALAARFLLTLPGSPFIYYGDELGMKGYRYEGEHIPGYGVVYDEYRRQPFMWGNQDIETTWLPSDGSNQQTANLEQQKLDETSLYHVYRDMIHLRRENPALQYGNTFYPYKHNNSNVQGFVRHYHYENVEQAVLVIHNLSSQTLNLELNYTKLLFGSLSLEGYGTLIVEIDAEQIEAYR